MEEQVQNSSEVLKIGKWEVSRKTVKTIAVVGIVGIVIGVAVLAVSNKMNAESVGEIAENVGEIAVESIID